jgi:ribose-phosphate pyrophosphokinase
VPAPDSSAVRLWVGPGSHHLKRPLETALGLRAMVAERQVFPDGEVCVRIPDSDTSETVVIVQGTHPPQDRHLQELYQLVEVAASVGAARIVCAVPYLAYARQDRRTMPGEPASCELVLRTLDMLGATVLAAVDVHNPAVLQRARLDAVSVPTDSVFAAWIERLELSAPALVAADDGGHVRVAAVARQLGLDFHVCSKSKDSRGLTTYPDEPPPVAGRDVVVLDDLCSSGSTLLPLAEHLRDGGARRLFYGVSHFFADGSKLVRDAALPTVVAGTDTIATEWSAMSVAPALAEWIRGVAVPDATDGG